MHTPSTKTIAVVFIIACFFSCSPYRKIENQATKLHLTLLGKWEVNKRIPKAGNNLVLLRGLPTGTITYYPYNRFMYRNKHGRYTGDWEIASALDWTEGSSEGGHNGQAYGTYKVSLRFNGDMPVYYPDVTMEMMYARKKKMKFVEKYKRVNIFER